MATGFTYRHYILKDHLGSWTTITDAEGNVEQELSFDAWGTLRDPETWHGFSQAEPVEAPMFDRGYTGHEHMTAFGLINMNGRCYDPLMSSFLSVDEYVQDPTSAQNFNRYAYCLNNPLKYTDPSGWYYVGGGHSSTSLQGPYECTWTLPERRTIDPSLVMDFLDYWTSFWEGEEFKNGGSVGGENTNEGIGSNDNSPSVVTDAGHGAKGKGDRYIDHGACSGSFYESDFAIIIETATAKWLEQYGISITRTRTQDDEIVNGDKINYRWQLANESGADVFISIHLNNGGSADEVFALYQQGKGDYSEASVEFGECVMSSLSELEYLNISTKSLYSVKEKSRYETLGVLNNFDGRAGILLEFGSIGSIINRNMILNNSDAIGQRIAIGIYNYLYKGNIITTSGCHYP